MKPVPNPYLIVVVLLLLALSAGRTAALWNQRSFIWTEQQVRNSISTNRNADWYPVARGTNYAVHTWDGEGIKAPRKAGDKKKGKA